MITNIFITRHPRLGINNWRSSVQLTDMPSFSTDRKTFLISNSLASSHKLFHICASFVSFFAPFWRAEKFNLFVGIIWISNCNYVRHLIGFHVFFWGGGGGILLFLRERHKPDSQGIKRTCDRIEFGASIKIWLIFNSIWFRGGTCKANKHCQ